jgi:hypothetical protein
MGFKNIFNYSIVLFVIVFMTSDCICDHAWVVLRLVLYPNAIWWFDVCMYVCRWESKVTPTAGRTLQCCAHDVIFGPQESCDRMKVLMFSGCTNWSLKLSHTKEN